MDWRSIGYAQFLEKNEQVELSIRNSFRKTGVFIIGSSLLAGGMTWGIGILQIPYDFWIQLTIISLTGIKIFMRLWIWYMEVMLITNMGLLFVNWTNFFHKKLRRLDFPLLEEIEYEQKGVADFLNNTGDVHFRRTNSEVFTASNVSSPRKVVRLVERKRAEFLNHKNFTEESELKNIITQLVITNKNGNGDENSNTTKEILEQKQAPKQSQKNTKRFHNEIIEIEKILDDHGGIEIDLDETDNHRL